MDNEKIRKTCETLLKAGKRPTVRGVLDLIGGSTRDVAPVVRDWLSEREGVISPRVKRAIEAYQALDRIEVDTFLDETLLQRRSTYVPPPRGRTRRRNMP